MNKKHGIALVCLATLVALALAACGPAAGQSGPSSAGSLPVHVPSVASSSASVAQSISVPAVSTLSPSGIVYKDPFNPYVAPQLPPAPYNKVNDIEKLYGSWFFYADPETEGFERPVYQIRVAEDYCMVSVGIFETDAGVFYWGDDYMFENGEITTGVKRSSIENPGTIVEEIKIMAEYSASDTNTIVFTVTAVNISPEFEEAFTNILGKKLPYTFYM
ncbi:hypothetical protein LJC61_00555 [Ruminococcaceae bacterium OttesenSCG-928-A16]|nr:hypothetical protein [Ruminococcaceae bacterium OttesenSCG-928-A16]